jgi:transposase-like protein
MALMKSFYNLAAAALGAEEEDPFPAFGPPLKRCWRHPGGRPPKYTPELALRIGLLVTQGEQTIKAALKICGVCRASKKNWRKEHRLFDAMLLALEESRAVFPRKYSKSVISLKKERAARERRRRYVQGKAAQR